MKNKCKLCGYEWKGREDNPKACPKCKRYDWKEGNKKDEVKQDAF